MLQNPGDLSAKKGELVKVTNSVIEKKLCVAVKTNGDSGTIRKKNLQQVVPGEQAVKTHHTLSITDYLSHILHVKV